MKALPEQKLHRLKQYDYSQNGYLLHHDLYRPPQAPPVYGREHRYDEVIRNDAHLDAVRAYIDANPARWPEDEYYTE